LSNSCQQVLKSCQKVGKKVGKKFLQILKRVGQEGEGEEGEGDL
jgi:hypothetical protein